MKNLKSCILKLKILYFVKTYFTTPLMRRVIDMKKNKKKFIRNGALVCGGVILLGASYFLGVKKEYK